MKYVIGEIHESQFEYVDFIRHPHGDIKYVTESVSLEYRGQMRDRNLILFNLSMTFKAMSLDEITKGESMDKDVHRLSTGTQNYEVRVKRNKF